MKDIGVVNGRFQVLNLKHMEYILAAKMRCQKLFIGLTNPDTLHTRDSVNDENRSAKSANPLTYYERYEMIRGAMREFKVPDSEYDILPFPINCPEYILQYVPKDATFYLGICDEWDEEKYKILRRRIMLYHSRNKRGNTNFLIIHLSSSRKIENKTIT